MLLREDAMKTRLDDLEAIIKKLYEIIKKTS